MKLCSVDGCNRHSFGKDKKTGLPFCLSHQYLRTDSKRYIAGNKKKPDLINEDGEKEQTELQKWYAGIMEREEPVCWETGESISTSDILGWHGSIAHCLPKLEYPSVRTHPLNYMILKMWGGTHGQYDSNWKNASKMKVWKHACKVFNILYPLLTREEKKKLPDVILQEINPEK